MTYTQPFLPATSQEVPVLRQYSRKLAIKRIWTWSLFVLTTLSASVATMLVGRLFVGIGLSDRESRDFEFAGYVIIVVVGLLFVAPFIMAAVGAFPGKMTGLRKPKAFRYNGPFVLRCTHDEQCECFVEFDGRTLTWTQPSVPDSFDHITWGTVEYADDVLLALRDVGGNTVYAYNRSVLQILNEII